MFKNHFMCVNIFEIAAFYLLQYDKIIHVDRERGKYTINYIYIST